MPIAVIFTKSAGWLWCVRRDVLCARGVVGISRQMAGGKSIFDRRPACQAGPEGGMRSRAVVQVDELGIGCVGVHPDGRDKDKFLAVRLANDPSGHCIADTRGDAGLSRSPGESAVLGGGNRRLVNEE